MYCALPQFLIVTYLESEITKPAEGEIPVFQCMLKKSLIHGLYNTPDAQLSRCLGPETNYCLGTPGNGARFNFTLTKERKEVFKGSLNVLLFKKLD